MYAQANMGTRPEPRAVVTSPTSPAPKTVDCLLKKCVLSVLSELSQSSHP
jgi:hypothetical protein